ncbi:MAG: hypothetical protein P1U56_01855, partial [Saprospiraceae bacterium]|nr:hypothetical protein [Saprospiraceae bacterium]
MKKMIYQITRIITLLCLGLTTLTGQVLPEENYAFVFRDVQFIQPEVDVIGVASLDFELDYEDNAAQDYLREEIQVRLVYNRDQFTDKKDNHWT